MGYGGEFGMMDRIGADKPHVAFVDYTTMIQTPSNVPPAAIVSVITSSIGCGVVRSNTFLWKSDSAYRSPVVVNCPIR